MSQTATPTEPRDSRSAVDTLASLSVEELRRLAQRLDEEGKIVRSVIRLRTRQPERRLSLVGGEA